MDEYPGFLDLSLTQKQLNETFPRPELLTRIMFSAFWVPLAMSEASSSTFAAYILKLMDPKSPIGQLDNRSPDFVQVVAQGAVCLTLYFAYRLCMKLIKLCAIFKVRLLIDFSIAGFQGWQRFK